jgi:hypothetical protein
MRQLLLFNLILIMAGVSVAQETPGDPASFGQTLRVRVINVKNGRPLENQRVSILWLDGKRSIDKLRLQFVTDARGEVQFDVPKSAPAHLGVRADLGFAEWYCACDVVVVTEAVTQKGFVSEPPPHSGRDVQAIVKPIPGEILFRARATSWWVRVFRPLMAD